MPILVGFLCIGFSQHNSPDLFSKKKKRLDFRDAVPSCKKASVLGWLYGFLWTACHEPESKTHSILDGFRLFLRATLLIRRRYTCASYLTDLYLECRYIDFLGSAVAQW